MKMFLEKLFAFIVEIAALTVLCNKMGADPTWCLLGLWVWKDLSETMENEDRI